NHSETGTIIKLHVSETKPNIVAKVIDPGEGLPEKDLPHIFDRLYRVEKSGSRLSGGAGLGLPIVKEIIEAHGGGVEVTSQKNIGTTIEITLLKRGQS